ncbi:MAG TPA: glucosyltransferase domain-containing protein [Pirellulaceae bacterium]|nr:glucosyltransferase domain-containing protein [Pirellulaceae bacterium]
MTKDLDQPMSLHRSELRGHVIAGLLLTVTVFGTYAVCLTSMVAHIDDYWLLWKPGPSLEVWNAAGRWANGLFFQATWYGADSIGDLWQPRLAALVGIFLFTVGIYASLRRMEYSWLFAVAAAVLAALLPTFNVYAVWATCAGHVYACLAAMLAFWLAEESSRRGEIWQTPLGHAATIVLYVAVSIYQPAGMFYVTMLVMALAAKDGGQWSQRQLLRVVIHASVLAVALGASVLTFKLMAREVQEIDIPGKGEFTTDYIKKLGRFVLQPVGQSCIPYFFVNHWQKWLMFPVEVVILGVFVPVGLWLRFGGSPSSRMWRIAALLALIPFTYLPNLLVASDYFPMRTRPAISVAILFLLLLATAGYLRRLLPDERLRRQVAGVGLAVAFGIAFAMARYHLHDYFFVPSRIEWDVVCAEVKRNVETGPARPRRVVFIMPDSEKPVARRFIYGEFGYLSASCDWVTEGMTGLAVTEVAPDKLSAFRDAQFVNIPREAHPPDPEPQDWVINARRLNEIGDQRRKSEQ